MFPDIALLRPNRIKQKLRDGLTPAQIAVWFSSESITRVLATYTGETLGEFVRNMQASLILKTEEKSELIVNILNNNIERAIDKLCVYLQQKSDEDITEFADMLRERPALAALSRHFDSVLQRCLQFADTQPNRPEMGEWLFSFNL